MIKLFQIDAIEAKRFIKPENMSFEVRIDNNSTINSIKKLDDKTAEITFRFTATYAGIGSISIDGTLIYEGDANKLEEEWTKKRRIPDDNVNEIHGVIINNCVIEATCLSKEVRLPPPTPPPAQFMGPKQPDKKTDGYGYA